MWDKFKTRFSFLITAFSTIFSIVSGILFDQISVEIRVIIILSIIALLLFVTVIVFSIHDQKKYDALLRLYQDRCQKHKALSEQYKNKTYLLDIHRANWNHIVNHISLLKAGKISERADSLQELYIKLNNEIIKEEQEQ